MDVPCWYKALEDNTGHYVNYIYYRISSWVVEPGLWRNAPTMYNWCTGQYDGVYSHDFHMERDICTRGDPPGSACKDWASAVEMWQQKPPTIAKMGLHHQRLDWDGNTSFFDPGSVAFKDPSDEANGLPLWELYYLQANSTYETGTFQDDDGDDVPNATDADVDGDRSANVTEQLCGALPPTPAWNPYVQPERIDGVFAGVSDDGDSSVDEPLPSGTESIDCDGDGFVGTSEAHVFSTSTVRDQDPCGTSEWPADLVSGAPGSFSYNKVNMLDLASFTSPEPRHLNTSPGDPGYDVRWDVSPGSGGLGKDINIIDIATISGLVPPMLGVRAFNGPDCPWPP